MSELFAEQGGPGLGDLPARPAARPRVCVRVRPTEGGAGEEAGQPGDPGRPAAAPALRELAPVGATRGSGLCAPFMGGPAAVYPAPNLHSVKLWVKAHIRLVRTTIYMSRDACLKNAADGAQGSQLPGILPALSRSFGTGVPPAASCR
jgi:hypothetical protein